MTFEGKVSCYFPTVRKIVRSSGRWATANNSLLRTETSLMYSGTARSILGCTANGTMSYNSLHSTTGEVRVLMNGGSCAQGICIHLCCNFLTGGGNAWCSCGTLPNNTQPTGGPVHSWHGQISCNQITQPPEGCPCGCKVRASSGLPPPLNSHGIALQSTIQ